LISAQALEGTDEGELYVEGAGNILSLPEFRDYEVMKSLVHLLDEKKLLGEILSRELADISADEKKPGVQVKIGSENDMADLKNLSLISSTYDLNDRTVGVLGIIGPKRMEYSHMISLVSHVAKAVSQVLERL